MLVDCMFSQPYQSLIESQNRCLDYLNPSYVIERNVNQFETTARVYICIKRFPLLLISVTNLSMKLFFFF